MFSLSYKRLRKYQYSTLIPLLLVGVDFGIILFLLKLLEKYQFIFGIDVQGYLMLSLNMAFCWVMSGLLASAYRIESLDRVRKIIIQFVYSCTLYLCLIFFLIGIRSENRVQPGMLLILSAFPLLAILVARLLLYYCYRFLQQSRSNRRRVIIIGNTARGKELSNYFKANPSLPQQYLGFFDHSTPTQLDEIPMYLGKLGDVKEYCLQYEVKEIYYALDQQKEFFTELSVFADEHFIFLGVIPNVDGIDLSRRVDTMLYNDSRIPIISSRKVPLRLIVNLYVKRLFDITFSALALLILCFTVFPVVALAIKLSSPGPVFFRQLRPGRNNKLFWCFKFRTMKLNSDENKQATQNDCRITKVGVFLRKSSFDELPQFYNVLIGDMSVVGPRPNLIIHLEQYPKEIREYALRHWVTPGITGYAQVSGFRGETKEVFQMQKRVEYDLLYIENWSLTLDLLIIGKTVVNMLKGEENAI